MDNTPYTYIPPILSRAAMSARTAKAAQALADAAGNPWCLEMTAFPAGAGKFGLGDPSLLLNEPSSLQSVAIEEALLQPRFAGVTTTGLLQDLVYHAVTDSVISAFAAELLQDEYIEDDHHCQAHVLVMPGAVKISHPLLLSQAKKNRDFLTREEMSVTIDQIEGGDLGFFAAGVYESAHEALEAQKTISELKPFWGPLTASFNDLDSSIRGNFRIADPEIRDTPVFVPSKE